MRVAAAARRRLVLRRLIAVLGPALLVGVAAGLLGVGATRLWPGLGPWIPWLAIPIAAAALIAAMAALARRPALLTAAATVDHALRLRDRLTNGVALARSGAAGEVEPFASLALQEAEVAAAGANLRRALPIRFGQTWAWSPAVLAAAVAVGLFVPQRTTPSPQQLADQHRAEQREQTAAAIQQAIQETEEQIDPENLDLATRERLDALEELERQLVDGRIEPSEAMNQALRTLDDAAERQQEEARQALAAHDALRERLAAGEEAPREDADASPLAEALHRGDLEAARREAEALLNRRDEIAPEEADRLAADLRQLAQSLRAEEPPPEQPAAEPSESAGAAPDEQVADASQPPDAAAPGDEQPAAAQQPQAEAQSPPEGEDQAEPPDSEPQSELEEALRQQGVPPEQAREMAEQPDPEQVRQELEDRGVDPQIADQVADAAEQKQREQQAQRQADQEARRLSDALERAADSLQQQQPRDGRQQPEQQKQQSAQEQQQQGQSAQRQQQGQSGQQQQGQQQRQTPGQQQTPDHGQPRQQQGPGQMPVRQQQPRPSDQGQPQEQPSTKPGQGSQQTPQPEPGDASGQDQQPRQGEQLGEERQQTPTPGVHPGEQQQPRPSDQPGDQQQPRPGVGTKPVAEPGPGGEQNSDGLRRLVDELKRQEQRGESSEESQRNADRLRQQARRVLESASPEERDRFRRWAEQAAAPQGDSGRQAGDGSRPHLAEQNPELPGDFQEDLVDARSDQPAPASDNPRRERVIAEWYSDQPSPEGDPSTSTASPAAAEAIARARRAAERDMGDRTIHPRYHQLLREYFRRLPQSAPDAESE